MFTLYSEGNVLRYDFSQREKYLYFTDVYKIKGILFYTAVSFSTFYKTELEQLLATIKSQTSLDN